MLSSSPTTPGTSMRRPPLRTYGKRSAGHGRVEKRPAEGDSDTDTDTDSDSPKEDGLGNAEVTPTNRDVKRVRTMPSASSQGSSSIASTTDASGSQSRHVSAQGSGNSVKSTTAVSWPKPTSASSSSVACGSIDQPGVAVQPPSSSPPSRLAKGSGTRTPTRRGMSPPGGSPSPRDLSALFVGVSRAPTPGSPAAESQGTRPSRPKVRRRMLSKSQSMHTTTSSSVNTLEVTPSTPRALRTAQSMPITPSSANSAHSAEASVHSSPSGRLGGVTQPITDSPGSGGRAMRTYGRSRSYLTSAVPMIDDDDEASSFTLVDEPVRESYNELRKKYEVDNVIGEGGGSGNLLDELMLARAPEPVSDMRSRGENRRFMDEIAFLTEGITSATSAGLKRTSSIDILRNMQEESWVSKLNVCGQTERVFDVLCGAQGNDEVMEAVCLLFLAILVTSGGGLSSVLQSQAEPVVRLCTRNLVTTAGPLDSAYKGSVSNAIKRLRGIYLNLYPNEDTARTRRLASLILSKSCHDSAWPYIEEAVRNERTAHRALTALVTEFRPLADRLELFGKGLNLITQDGGVDTTHLEQTLAVLGGIVSRSSEDRDILVATDGKLVAELVDLLVALTALALDHEQTPDKQALKSLLLCLQLLAPLASTPSISQVLANAAKQPTTAATLGRLLLRRNDVAAALRRAATPDPTGPDPDDEGAVGAIAADDILSPILALLSGMLSTPAVASAMATTPISACSKRACVTGCRCASATPFATVFTELYAAYGGRADAAGAAALTGYLHGYIAFLVTRLLVSAPDAVRPLVEEKLPGDAWEAKLEALWSVLNELSSVNAIAYRKLRGEGGSAAGEDDGSLHEAMGELRQLINQM